jgi:hypothetical protein
MGRFSNSKSYHARRVRRYEELGGYIDVGDIQGVKALLAILLLEFVE